MNWYYILNIFSVYDAQARLQSSRAIKHFVESAPIDLEGKVKGLITVDKALLKSECTPSDKNIDPVTNITLLSA